MNVSNGFTILSIRTAKRAGDLAPWRLARHKIGKPFMEAYFRHFPVSAPEEDQEDRSVLYCL